MDCSVCRELKRAYETGLSEYEAARGSAYYRISTKIAASKQVDMERARYELEVHQLVCDSTVKASAPLVEQDRSASLRGIAA
jgi:hypothetical protein